MTTPARPALVHHKSCPRLQFWDAGEHEAGCLCPSGWPRREKPDRPAPEMRWTRGSLEEFLRDYGFVPLAALRKAEEERDRLRAENDHLRLTPLCEICGQALMKANAALASAPQEEKP